MLIAGGGVALGGRARARGSRGDTGLDRSADAGDEFVFRPLLVGEPFDRTEARHVPLRELLAGRPVRHVQDGLAAVDGAARCVRTTSGADRSYDALLVASGARTAEAVPGALTFDGPSAVSAYRELLADLDWARVKRVVFTLAPGAGWSIPLYEFALLTAAHLSDRGMTTTWRSSRRSRRRSPRSGRRRASTSPICWSAATSPFALASRRARRRTARCCSPTAFGRRSGRCPPALGGHSDPGLPADAEGFVPVDEHGRVGGLEHVYAAGDVTAWPHKQGGLASQQADAAAETIAAWAGAPVQPAPFRPVLRGLLLTDDRPVFLRGQDVGSPEETSTATTPPLWRPAGKIAGRHLTAYLQTRGGSLRRRACEARRRHRCPRPGPHR